MTWLSGVVCWIGRGKGRSEGLCTCPGRAGTTAGDSHVCDDDEGAAGVTRVVGTAAGHRGRYGGDRGLLEAGSSARPATVSLAAKVTVNRRTGQKSQALSGVFLPRLLRCEIERSSGRPRSGNTRRSPKHHKTWFGPFTRRRIGEWLSDSR